MFEVTISLPTSIKLRTLEDGTPLVWDIEALASNPDILARIFEGGARTLLTNCYNGGGKEGSEAERVAQVKKRTDAWERGEYVVVSRGEAGLTPLRDAFVAEQMARGMSKAAVDKHIRDTVAGVLGKDAKASFDNFLDATAAGFVEADKAPDVATARKALEAHYDKLATERAKAAAKAKASVSIDIDLGDFAL